MAERVLYIPSDTVKNEFRARVVPLNDAATKAIIWALNRAREVGASSPDHYLFPFRVKPGTYDPTRHPSVSFIRGAFREIKAAAGLPWLRPHDLRHNSITKLLELPNVSEETVKAIAGHVSKNILQTYSHIRIEAKRNALDGLSQQRRTASRVITPMAILRMQALKAEKTG